jgi:hypothetical protein
LTDDGVRLRVRPGTTQPILIENLGRGTIVTSLSDQLVSANGHDWRNVQTAAGQEGWVANEFLGPVNVVEPGRGTISICQLTIPAKHWDERLAADIFPPQLGLALTFPIAGRAEQAEFSLGGNVVFFHDNVGRVWYLAHLRNAGRASGPVAAGQPIGIISNTGNANKRQDGIEHLDEAHVHLAVATVGHGIDNEGAGDLHPQTEIRALC